MRKGHPLLEEINKVIREEAVIFMKIYYKYMSYKWMDYCMPDNKPKPLSEF